jgi:uncharacterized protein (DUF486 family)
MFPMLPRWLTALLLLIGSNLFMTVAWYNHLKHPRWTMLTAILISWVIALPEYCLQVPANRLGSNRYEGPFTTPQLKIMQEAITLIAFVGFSILVLDERPKWTDYAGFALIFLGVAVSMLGPAFFQTAAR